MASAYHSQRASPLPVDPAGLFLPLQLPQQQDGIVDIVRLAAVGSTIVLIDDRELEVQIIFFI